MMFSNLVKPLKSCNSCSCHACQGSSFGIYCGLCSSDNNHRSVFIFNDSHGMYVKRLQNQIIIIPAVHISFMALTVHTIILALCNSRS
jgi:hypothetical protein